MLLVIRLIITMKFIYLIQIVAVASAWDCRISTKRNITSGILQYYKAMEAVLNPLMYRFISSNHDNCFDRYSKGERSIKTIGLYGDRKCQKRTVHIRPERRFDLLNDSVLCPWYYDLTYDVNRIPSMIPQARCRCGECKGISGKYCQVFGLEQTVVRRANSESEWTPTLEWIYVACLCVER